VRLGALSVAVSASLLVNVSLHVAYGAWATALVLDDAGGGPADPWRALAGLRRWFWRVLGLESVGWCVLFATLAAALALGPGALPVTLVLMVLGSLAWNLATAALLPAGLDGRLSFGAALRHGVRASWAGKARWWKPVVLQLLLLGLVTFIHVPYTDAGPGRYAQRSRTEWGVNAFWTGGYESDCR
jgi:hypothetical protein